MKKPGLLLILIITLLFFNACRNKTIQLLTKNWDCIQVDNIVAPGTKFQSAEDSANFIQLQSLLQSIKWAFKKNMKYECTVNNSITVQGSYELIENDKILICTPGSKNAVNRYVIILLTKNELVLSAGINNTNLVLHFKPNQ